jgi:hypothetical protein
LGGLWSMSISSLTAFKLAFGAGLAIAASTIAASAINLTDNTFTDVTVLSPTYSSDPGTTVSGSVCVTCLSSGGAALQTINNAAASNATGKITTSVGYLDNSLQYNPATQGTISSITFTEQKDVTITGGPAGTLTTHMDPMIYQGGNYYMYRIAGPTLSYPGTILFFTQTASGLTASDFVLFDLATGSFGTGNPDFSSTGGAMKFGLIPYTQDLFAGQIKTSIADDLSFSIVPGPIAGSGLPGILFAGSGLLVWWRQRKVKKNAVALAAA